MSRKLNQYRGRLNAAQVAEGINAALENARRLVADARILLSAGAYPSAASLAILSVEESGKCSILRALALARHDADLNEGWKDFRSHTKKNVSWILADLVANGARRIEDLRAVFDQTSDHPYELDQLKQLGFYTDCLGGGRWSRPIKAIDEQVARVLVWIADALANTSQCSEKEIELWVKYMSPVWKGELLQMKQAISNWYRAMQEAGLKGAGPNLMEDFVGWENKSP